MTKGELLSDAAQGISIGAVVFIEDLATRILSGVLIAVISGLIVHVLRKRLEKNK